MKFRFPLSALVILSIAAPAGAATLYDLSTTSLSGGGQNTFAASTTNASGAGGVFSGTLPGNLVFTDGTGAAQNYDYFIGKFSSISLTSVGTKITLSFTATGNNFLNDGTGQVLRLGLFNIGSATTGSGTPAANSFSAATGYRVDYGAASVANGVRERTSANNNLFSSGNSPLLGGQSSSDFTFFPADATTFSGSFTIELTTATSVTITSQIGGLSATSVIDSASPFTTFDSFGFFASSGATKASLNFTNLQVAVVPEPATSALVIAGLGFFCVVCRRVRRSRSE